MSKTSAASRRYVALNGGFARAASLTATRRSAIATQAARARWSAPALVLDRRPRDHGELRTFVANCGARVSKDTLKGDLSGVVVQALKAARRDSSVARMLPVFFWRMRERLDFKKMVAAANAAGEVCSAALGYFLGLAGKLGSFDGFDTSRLRPCKSPVFFFRGVEKHPFEVMVAAKRTPEDALAWGLLTGTPTDSFETYFRKVAHL